MEQEVVEMKSLTGSPAATIPGLNGIMGAITGNSGPELYVRGTDGNLWSNVSPSTGWTNLGAPAPGVTIQASAGTIFSGIGYAYVFVLGSDGNLWCWTASSGAWMNQGVPPNVTLLECVGSVSVRDGNTYTYVTGRTGNQMHLWLNFWAGDHFQWMDLGAPPFPLLQAGNAIGAVISGDGSPYAYITSNDGNVWCNWWNEGSGFVWTNYGMTPNRADHNWIPLGSASLPAGSAFIFYLGFDPMGSYSDIWCNSNNGSGFTWSDLGKPPGNIKIRLGGLSCSSVIMGGDGNPYMFTMCDDNNLWCCTLQNAAWVWINLGAPAPGLNYRPYYGDAVAGSSRPTVFVTGNDGNIWNVSWNGTNWVWASPFQS